MNRREFLLASATMAAASTLKFRGAFAATATTSRADELFADLDATAQAELVRNGDVKPSELLDAAIRRVKALNPKINAVVTTFYEEARATASQGPLPDGPFRGVPYAIKDLVDLKGTRRTAGSRLLAENVSGQTSEIVQRSLEAGFVIIGKTNTPEFALSATTESLLLGPARNPWNLEYSPGGSSGGAAAAVASGMFPLAHASDGGGSIRIPSSCCGVFGLKPSRGRMVGSHGLDLSEIGVEHCVSRSVRDSAALFAWNERRDSAAPLPPVGRIASPSNKRLKIGYSTLDIYGKDATESVKSALSRTAQLCESLGHRIEGIRIPVDGEEFLRAFMTVWGAGAARVVRLAQSRGTSPQDILEPWTLHLAAHFAGQPAGALPDALNYFGELGHTFEAFFQRYDMMLTPVLHSEPPPLGYLGPATPSDQLWDRLTSYASFTPVQNAAGIPAMSIPSGRSTAGLPIGSQFAARAGAEGALFELAFELEQARPWALQWPPVSTRYL